MYRPVNEHQTKLTEVAGCRVSLLVSQQWLSAYLPVVAQTHRRGEDPLDVPGPGGGGHVPVDAGQPDIPEAWSVRGWHQHTRAVQRRRAQLCRLPCALPGRYARPTNS